MPGYASVSELMRAALPLLLGYYPEYGGGYSNKKWRAWYVADKSARTATLRCSGDVHTWDNDLTLANPAAADYWNVPLAPRMEPTTVSSDVTYGRLAYDPDPAHFAWQWMRLLFWACEVAGNCVTGPIADGSWTKSWEPHGATDGLVTLSSCSGSLYDPTLDRQVSLYSNVAWYWAALPQYNPDLNVETFGGAPEGCLYPDPSAGIGVTEADRQNAEDSLDHYRDLLRRGITDRRGNLLATFEGAVTFPYNGPTDADVYRMLSLALGSLTPRIGKPEYAPEPVEPVGVRYPIGVKSEYLR